LKKKKQQTTGIIFKNEICQILKAKIAKKALDKQMPQTKSFFASSLYGPQFIFFFIVIVGNMEKKYM